MALETLELRVLVTGAGQVENELGRIQRSASGINDTLRFMRGALVLFSFARVFEGAFAAVNSFQEMFNKLRLVTNSSLEAQQAQFALAKAAVETRASYEDTVNVFAALARSTKALNLDYGQLLTLTKEWNQSIVVSGVDAQQSRNALKDFVEELNLGVIQGRQLRALLMQNPEFLRLMAEGMVKVGKGSEPWFAAVRKATEGGKTLGGQAFFELNKAFPGTISSAEAVMAAILGAHEEALKFNLTTETLQQSWTVLKTKAELFFATLTQKTGGMDALKDAISWIGDHLEVITMAVAAFAGLLIFNAITSALVTFGGTMSSVLTLLTTGFRNLFTLAQRFFAFIITDEGLMVLPLILLGTVLYGVFHTQMNDAASNFGKKVQDMGGWLEFFLRLFTVIESELQTAFTSPLTLIKAAVEILVNATIDSFEFLINKIIDGANFASTKLNTILPQSMQIGQMGNVKLGRMDQSDVKDFAAEFEKNLEANYKTNETMLRKFESLFSLPNIGELDLKGKPPGAGKEGIITTDDADALRRLTDALAQLAAMLDKFEGPAGKFDRMMEQTHQKLVDMTSAHGKTAAAISAHRVAQEFLARGYADFNEKTLTSVSYENDEMRSALGLAFANKNLASTIELITRALDRKAISEEEATRLTNAAHINALKEDQSSITNGVEIATRQFNATLSDHNKIAEETVTTAMKEDLALAKLGIQYRALKEAVDSGTLSQKQAAEAMRDLQIQALSTSTEMSDGFVRGMLEVQKSMNDTATTAADALKNSFKSLEDTLVEFFDTGKLNAKKFADEILAQFTRLAVQSAIMQPLTNALGFGSGQSSGSSPLTGLLSMFGGGSGALPNATPFNGTVGALGSSAANPMWVQMSGIGNTPGSLPNGSDSSGGLFSTGGGMLSDLFGSSATGNGSIIDLGGGTASLDSAAGFGNSGISGMLGSLFGGGAAGSSGGGFMSLLSSAAGLFGFAEGGDFLVGGRPGKDNNLVAFRASNDERVSIQTPAQQRAAAKGGSSGNGEMHLHLHGVQDFDSFKRSKSQMAAGMSVLAEHNRRRNGG